MKRVLIVAVVLGLIGAGLAWAGPAGAPPQAKQVAKVGYVLQCQPYGAAEFVNDVQIWNKGTKPVPNGTKVHWEVMNGQWKGDYTFAASLAPGAKVVLNNVMNGAQSSGNCSVKVVEPLHLTPQAMRMLKLGPPKPKFAIKAMANMPVIPANPTWKEIECGILLYPPTAPNANVTSRHLYWVNSTGAPFPLGTRLKWEIESVPANCCNGITGPLDFVLDPNPPSIEYAYWMNVLPVAQVWTRPCKAWALLP
jgi:hypothetical protein